MLDDHLQTVLSRLLLEQRGMPCEILASDTACQILREYDIPAIKPTNKRQLDQLVTQFSAFVKGWMVR